MLKANAQLNAKDNTGYTALMIAAENNRADAARFLLQAGALPEATDSDGLNTLMIAAFKGHISTIKLLIQYGVNINAKTTKEVTIVSIEQTDRFNLWPQKTNYRIPVGSTALDFAEKFHPNSITTQTLIAAQDPHYFLYSLPK